MTEPLIKLDTAGQAPLLRYDLPEPTFYFGRNLIQLDLPTKIFKDLSASPDDGTTEPDDTEPDQGTSEPTKVTDEDVDDAIAGAMNRALVELGSDRLFTQLARYEDDLQPLDLDPGPIDPSQTGPLPIQQRKRPDRTGLRPLTGSATGELMVSNLQDSLGLWPLEIKANMLAGLRPYVTSTPTGGAQTVYVEEVPDYEPALFLVETYRMSNFRGEYSAGNNLTTAYLHPGERQKISVKTYKHTESTERSSKSLFDSYTTETEDEFTTSVQRENTDQESKNRSFNWDVEAEATGNWGVVKASVNSGMSGSTNSARETFAKNVSSASEKHAAKASGQRDITINTETEVTSSEGEETAIEREIENINVSRTLNVIYRQLTQNYISLLHLVDVQVAFDNGDPEARMQVPLRDLDLLLDHCIRNVDAVKEEVKDSILWSLGHIVDYEGVDHDDFVKTIAYPERDGSETEVHLVDPNKRSSYTTSGGRTFEVPGVLFAANELTLRTDGVIIDVVLGGAVALDSLAISTQEERIDTHRHENNARALENRKVSTALDIINDNDAERAALYAELFGTDFLDSMKDADCHYFLPITAGAGAAVNTGNGDADPGSISASAGTVTGATRHE